MAIIDNLIAYWSLDEASGSAIDAHGANDLTETGGTIDSATGKVGNARDFEVGDTEWFEIADNTDLSTGDVNFSLALWVWGETLASFPAIAHKGWTATPDANSEWVLYYSTSANRLLFSKRVAATVTATANNAGALSTSTWYFIVVYHDADNDLMSISVNDGTPNTTASATGVNNGTRVFQIGAISAQPLYWDGLIDEVGFWKKVLTPTEITWLYNAGAGRSYADIVAEAGGGGGVARQRLVNGGLIRGRLVA